MKKIVVTGGSEGIGLAIARLLAAEGAQLTLVARNADKLQAAVRSLPGQGHHFLAADLATPEGVGLVAELLDETRFDVFVNNAGVGLYGRFEELPLGKQLAMMRLNMEGVTVLAYHYLGRARAGDALVNTSSVLALTSLPGGAVYAATKAYVSNLSEGLWWEFKDRKVFVLGFLPGATSSNFHQAAGVAESPFAEGTTQTPEAVAKELVRALHRRNKPRVVSGAINRLMMFGMRWLPRKIGVNIMGGMSPIPKA
jgi:short-subunit dehydrogenase